MWLPWSIHTCKWTVTVTITGTGQARDNRNKKVIFTSWAPFTDCISEMNNIHADNAKRDWCSNAYL